MPAIKSIIIEGKHALHGDHPACTCAPCRGRRRLLPQSARQRAFTLIELVAVLVIVGVLAVVAIPRFFDRATFDERAFYDQVLSAIRYAQKTAIAQHRIVCVNFPANNQLVLTYGNDTNCGNALANPSGQAYLQDIKGIVFSPLPTRFSFDCLGRPRNGVAVGQCTDLIGVSTANQTVKVQNMPVITIERETGYVHSP